MDRMGDRLSIAAVLDGAAEMRRKVNEHPAVIAARADADAARKAADVAHGKFRRVFDAHYPRDDAVTGALARVHTDLILIGGADADPRRIGMLPPQKQSIARRYHRSMRIINTALRAL